MTTSANSQGAGETRLLTDFTAGTADFSWYVVNDNVMGGRSDGGFEIESGTLLFSGRTNTRGGGFSSVRARGPELDLSGFDGVRLRIRGDGRRYTWQVRTDARFRGRDVSYWAEFDTVSEEWLTVDLPFSAFVPRFRGVELDGGPPDPAQVRGMGLMINDGRDGGFTLSLDRVEAYTDTAPFTLDRYRWEKRVLVVSAPEDKDASLKQQAEEISRSLDEFESRDMVLVSLLDNGQSRAADRHLVDEDVAAARKALGIRPDEFAVVLIGKDGSAKLKRDSPTSMAEIYSLIDRMPMRRREAARSQVDDP